MQREDQPVMTTGLERIPITMHQSTAWTVSMSLKRRLVAAAVILLGSAGTAGEPPDLVAWVWCRIPQRQAKHEGSMTKSCASAPARAL